MTTAERSCCRRSTIPRPIERAPPVTRTRSVIASSLFLLRVSSDRRSRLDRADRAAAGPGRDRLDHLAVEQPVGILVDVADMRSEEHTSELHSLMRISYAVFCLKKTNTNNKSI